MEPRLLDLTSEKPAEDRLVILPQRDSGPPAAALAQETIRLETMREEQRGRIAYNLVLLLLFALTATVVLPVFFSLIIPVDASPVQEATGVFQAVGTTVLTPIVGLIGAVIGFYS